MYNELKKDSENVLSFRKIISEAIAAFPEDAHIRVLEYLEDKGMQEETLRKFKEAWGTVVLGNEAFGRKNKRTHIDGTLFADELITIMTNGGELQHEKDIMNYYIEVLLKVQEELSNLKISEDHYDVRQVNKFNACISVVNKIKQEYKYITNHILYQIPEDFFSFTIEDDRMKLRLLLAYRESLDHMKIIWRRGGDTSTHSSYQPINHYCLSEHSYKTGKIAIKTEKSSKLKLPPCFQSEEILGLEIAFDHSSSLEDVWETYGFLSEFIVLQECNMMPRPLEVVYVEETLHQIFPFELPTSYFHFTAYLTPQIIKFFYEYPGIVTMWCYQLSNMCYLLTTSLSGRLYSQLTMEQVLITQDGLLLLQEVGIEELPPAACTLGEMPSQRPLFVELEEEQAEQLAADQSRSAGSGPDSSKQPNQPKSQQRRVKSKYHDNFDRFVPFIYDLLANALARSRVEEPYIVPEVASFRMAGFALMNTEGAFPKVDIHDLLDPNNLRSHPAHHHPAAHGHSSATASASAVPTKKAPIQTQQQMMDAQFAAYDPHHSHSHSHASSTAQEQQLDDEEDDLFHLELEENLHKMYPSYVITSGCHLMIPLTCGGDQKKIEQIVTSKYHTVYGEYAEKEMNYEDDYSTLHIVYKVEDLDTHHPQQQHPGGGGGRGGGGEDSSKARPPEILVMNEVDKMRMSEEEYVNNGGGTNSNINGSGMIDPVADASSQEGKKKKMAGQGDGGGDEEYEKLLNRLQNEDNQTNQQPSQQKAASASASAPDKANKLSNKRPYGNKITKDTNAVIIIEAHSPCTLYIQLSHYTPDFVEYKHIERRLACLRIQIIPAKPMKSLYLQEVINHLESFYWLRIESIIFDTILFARARRGILQQEEKLKEAVRECALHWSEMKKALRLHSIT